MRAAGDTLDPPAGWSVPLYGRGLLLPPCPPMYTTVFELLELLPDEFDVGDGDVPPPAELPDDSPLDDPCPSS